MEIWQNLKKNATHLVIFLPLHKVVRAENNNTNNNIIREQGTWHEKLE